MSTHAHDARTTDDGFHEIQLSGKQLVFLFMATTVVSIVIFLCGVLVGRNARAERAENADPSAAATTAAAQQEPVEVAPPEVVPPAEAVAGGPGSPVGGYYPELKGDKPSQDLTPQSPAPAPPEGVADASPAPEPAQPPAQKAAEKVPAETPAQTKTAQAGATSIADAPPRSGQCSVQITALRSRADLEQLAARLISRGYPAYILAPAPGSPTQAYRLRVGNYDRREAQRVSQRLTREEQFKPWVTCS